MPTSIKKSGDKLGVYAIVAPKVKNVNVMFILPAGFILPTFRGDYCDWYVIETDKDGFVLLGERSKLKVYYTLQGCKKCYASGKWGELGSKHDVDLKKGALPPKEFSDLILVNKSDIQPGV